MTVDQIILAIIGMVVTANIAALGHLYKSLSEMQASFPRYQAELQTKLEQNVQTQLKDLWTQMHELSRQIGEDRKATSDSRLEIARSLGQMVTRPDMRTEMDRFLSEIDRRMPQQTRVPR